MLLALQTNQKKLVDSIASGSVKKIEKLLEAGLDPNFTTDDKSEIILCWEMSNQYACRQSKVEISQLLPRLLLHGLTLILWFNIVLFIPHLDTPLGVACGRNSNIHCIMPLLSGGAHIDFRGKEGLTPMHRAALGGNAQAINVRI